MSINLELANVKGSFQELSEYITLQDGSTWKRMLHQEMNKRNGRLNVFASYNEAISCNKPGLYSDLQYLNTYKATDGKFEFLLYYNDYPGKYNRWKQTDNPLNLYNRSAGIGTKVPGFEAIHLDFTRSGTASGDQNFIFCGLSRMNSTVTSAANTLLTGNYGIANWFYAVGLYVGWNVIGSAPIDGANVTLGAPGPNAGTVSSIDLLVRTDTVNNTTLRTNSLNAVSGIGNGQFIELLTPVSGDTIASTVPADTKWVRLTYFHTSAGYFASLPNGLRSFTSMNKWAILDYMRHCQAHDGYYEYIYRNPSTSKTIFHRIKQTVAPIDAQGWQYNTSTSKWEVKPDSPAGTVVDISHTSDKNPPNAKGFVLDNMTGTGKNTQATIRGWNPTAATNWWNAINTHNAYSSGIPGINGVTVSDAEFWIRTDNTKNYSPRVPTRMSQDFEIVEYSQANYTSNINLGYSEAGCTKIVVDMQVTQNPSADQKMIGTSDGVGIMIYGSKWRLICSIAGAAVGFYQSKTNCDLNRHLWEIKKDDGYYMDGVRLLDTSDRVMVPKFNGSRPIWIHALNNASVSNVNYSYTKFWGVTFYKGDEIVHKFVPCKRKSDGLVGMMDETTGLFYSSATSTQFTSGAYVSGQQVSFSKKTDSIIAKNYIEI